MLMSGILNNLLIALKRVCKLCVDVSMCAVSMLGQRMNYTGTHLSCTCTHSVVMHMSLLLHANPYMHMNLLAHAVCLRNAFVAAYILAYFVKQNVAVRNVSCV